MAINFQDYKEFPEELFVDEPVIKEAAKNLSSVLKKSITTKELFTALSGNKFYNPTLSISEDNFFVGFRGTKFLADVKKLAPKEFKSNQTNDKVKAIFRVGAKASAVEIEAYVTSTCSDADLVEEVIPAFKDANIEVLATYFAPSYENTLPAGTYQVTANSKAGTDKFVLYQLTVTNAEGRELMVSVNDNFNAKMVEINSDGGTLYTLDSTTNIAVPLTIPGGYSDLLESFPDVKIGDICQLKAVTGTTSQYGPQAFGLVEYNGVEHWATIPVSYTNLYLALAHRKMGKQIGLPVDNFRVSTKNGKTYTVFGKAVIV